MCVRRGEAVSLRACVGVSAQVCVRKHQTSRVWGILVGLKIKSQDGTPHKLQEPRRVPRLLQGAHLLCEPLSHAQQLNLAPYAQLRGVLTSLGPPDLTQLGRPLLLVAPEEGAGVLQAAAEGELPVTVGAIARHLLLGVGQDLRHGAGETGQAWGGKASDAPAEMGKCAQGGLLRSGLVPCVLLRGSALRMERDGAASPLLSLAAFGAVWESPTS
ncbi:hypothetical protein NDU88_000625 [Pleurodeles waltl]|uniref:Uncharacterized protein n=1 Tax=Pleurodeles waltl TaxID=8319 RepID=A0AAV7LAR7_PLEWA|nr:hypothetical protein NDU88_000625 [Pleurodeles waltl]